MNKPAPGWTTVDCADHPVEVFEPQRRNEHGFVLIYLHGVHLGRLAEQPPFLEQFERHGLPVVAPITQRSWWTDRLCAEFDPALSAERHLLDNILPLARRLYNAEPPQIGLFGASMGGQGALRLAYKHPSQFPVVAAISPAIDFHLRMLEGDETLPLMYENAEAARQDTAILHIHPLNWPRNQFFCCDPTDTRWYDGADRLRMKLASLGVPFECDLESEGGGHGVEYYGRQAERVVTFLVERLLAEQRRLP